MIVSLAGHVDHGKTALVRALTGVETDTLAEEKRRGLTIDLGFAYADFGGTRVGFVDVPGHHKFVHNMITGIARHQHALLVIAADDGVMPQTREHFDILKLLGVRSGTVAITKKDLVDEEWLDEIKIEIHDFLNGSFLEDAVLHETSTETGEGIKQLSKELTQLSTQFELGESKQCFRLAIDRSFSVRGQGTVVTGTVSDGAVNVDDQVVLSSTKEPVRIRSLRVSDLDANRAQAGDRCGINLAAVTTDSVDRGDWLVSTEAYRPSSSALVQIDVLDSYPTALKTNTTIHVYHQTAHTLARVRMLSETRLNPGRSDMATLDFEVAQQTKIGDTLILRAPDRQQTLGSAKVLEIYAESNSQKPRVSDLRTEVKSSAKTTLKPLARFQHEVGYQPVDTHHFRAGWNLHQETLDEIVSKSHCIRHNNTVLSQSLFDQVAQKTFRVLDAFHKAQPKARGIHVDRLIGNLGVNRETVRFVLSILLERSQISLEAGIYFRPDFQPEKPHFDKQLLENIKPHLDQANPLTFGDLSKTLRVPLQIIEKETQKMNDAEALVRISNRRALLPDHFQSFVHTARELASNDNLTVATFRDATGYGRNGVVQFLEYLDQKKLTYRLGDKRHFRIDEDVL